ncbi:transposase, partial [Burkholderia perseverans]|uniref:transposase n=1 Tax=Burkholderia perseverans TaxID=2615214 RepID=UPI001FEDE8E3
MSAQRFTPEFKQEAVRQITERGYSVAEVSARLGVSAHSLYKWVKPDKSEAQASELLEAKQEVLRLRAQMRRLEEERDILKKAAVGSMDRCNTFLLISNEGGLTNGTNG